MAISTGLAILGGAALGMIGSSMASKNAADASENAAQTSANSSNYATQMQMDYLRSVRKDIAGAVEAGVMDIDTGFKIAMKSLGPEYDAVNQYINLIQNPAAVMKRPGVQFQYQQGIDALQSGFSKTTGGGLSGNIVAAAQQYGQNFAATTLDAELSRLEPLVNLQLTRAQYANQAGANKANIRIGGATGSGNIGASVMPGIASTITNAGNATAQGIVASAGATNAAIGGITGTISDVASLYALRPDLFSSMGGSNINSAQAVKSVPMNNAVWT